MVERQGRRGRALIISVAAILVFALVPAVVTAATGDFEDVPPTNIFYNDIEWMAESGVTTGCSSTRFCPGDSVTRQQMAAFMHRLATNGSVDAGSLDGVSASQYAKKTDIQTGAPGAPGSRATGALSNDLDDVDGTALIAGLTSPANGVLILGANVDVTAMAGPDSVACWLRINGEDLSGVFMFTSVDTAGQTEAICSTSGIALVSAGDFTLELVVARTEGTAALYAGTLWAQWIPFDGTGAVPTLGADTFGDGSQSGKLLPGK